MEPNIPQAYYKVRYSNEKVEVVSKLQLDAVLRSGKKVFEVIKVQEPVS